MRLANLLFAFMMKLRIPFFIRSKHMEVTIVSDTIQVFKGERYYLSDQYFRRGGKCLHVVVWESANGPRPHGWHIHHKDDDKSNNQLSNLMGMTGKEHRLLHMKRPDRVERSRESIKTARLAASEWHGSEQGREWHSKHYQENIAPLKEVKNDLVCAECGGTYQISMIWSKNSIYCSNKCKSAARRKSGVDDIQRICAACQKPFMVNKYTKMKTCSHRCSVDLRWGRATCA
jgi:hypothetical protein